MNVSQLPLKRRIWQAAAVAGLAALLFALFSPGAGAQGTDPPPHWFYGIGYHADNGATVRFISEASGEEVTRVVISAGTWALFPNQSDAATGRIEIVGASGVRRTDVFTVGQGSLTPVEPSQFTAVAAPPPPPEPEPEPEPPTDTDSDEIGDEDDASTASSVMARIVARVSDNEGREGRLEFGMQIEGQTDVITPRARYFPASLPESRIGRWLHSTEIELGNGVSGRVIARRNADGRTEFAFDATGGDDCVPSARYFPAEDDSRYPDHSRWLKSPVLNIPTDCTDERGS